MNKTAKKINAQIELNDDYKKLNISDFKLPDFKPMPDIGNITNAYLSAFNTGMTIYECLSWLQGYVQANRDALVQLIGDLNKFQESIENALNSIVENLKELDAKLEKETEDRKAADIILDGKITTEKEERTAEDALLNEKIDQTKKDLDESLKNLDTYVKKTGDYMTGPLVLKSKTDEASPDLPEKGGAITFYTDENTAAEGLPADYTTVSKSFITNRPQSSTEGDASGDRVYGMHFYNQYSDLEHQKQRFIFNQEGDYRILVRDLTKPVGERSDLLWGEQIAYLSDLKNLTPTGGASFNLSFSNKLNAYTNRETGVYTPCENVVVEPSINTKDVIFDIVEDISDYDYILVGVQSTTWANSKHYEQILVPCKKSKLYGEYNGVSITQEGENNTFKYTSTLDFKCFQDTDGFYKVECKAFGTWENGLNVTMRGAKAVPYEAQSGGVTTQILTAKTRQITDNGSTSAVAVQVETEEDLTQFKMFYVCLASTSIQAPLTNAISFLMPVEGYGWGEVKTIVDPSMHLHYVGCQGVTDGKINFNLANLSGAADTYTINSIVGIK